MPADRPLVTAAPERAGPRSDLGISLIEVMVAIVVIGTVMAAAAPFLVRSVLVVDQQRTRQVAIQVANDALERARALDPSSLLAGRSKLATDDLWSAAPAAVTAYLATMLKDWDPQLPADRSVAGGQAPLPTEPNIVSVDGEPYSQRWYVGKCWQAKVSRAATVAGACGTANPLTTDVPFFRVVATVTWNHRSCPASGCIYIASTLASIGPDPRFDLNRPPPVITDPPNQATYTDRVVNLQLSAKDGALPLTWTAAQLPPGLNLSSGGGLITGTPTTAGTYAVVITATGVDGRADSTSFTWLVVLPPALTNPGLQRNTIGKTISPLAITAVGGMLPLTWSASGLPLGLTINTGTGVITGTPTTAGSRAVVVTITDTGVPARSATVSFTWQMYSQVVMYNPGPQTIASNTDVGQGAFAFYATGGLAPYVYRADNLPTSLTLNTSTGAVTGDIIGTRYIITAYVTDSLGDVDSITLLLTVTPYGTDLRVTTPSPSTPDRSTAVNVTPTVVNAVAAGGTTPYTWTARGLPSGLTLGTNGVIAGKPDTRGSYVVSYTVTDRYGRTAVLMFTWTIT
jgi:type II secretory pathway pseudopilin PulG